MSIQLQNYFAQPGSPSAGSPVGNLMVRILAKFPDLSFDAARAEAQRLLNKAAGKFRYSTPQVLSKEQQDAAKARFNALKRPGNPVSSTTSTTQTENTGSASSERAA